MSCHNYQTGVIIICTNVRRVINARYVCSIRSESTWTVNCDMYIN